jgi:hypothetical protein
MTFVLRTHRPSPNGTSQAVEDRTATAAGSRKRPQRDVETSIGGLSRRPRTADVSDSAGPSPFAPRSLPKARARALDPLLGPAFDRKLAAELHPGLAGYLNELEAAYRENRTPAVEDNEHLKLIVEGLNRADPGLRLEHDAVMQFEPACWVEKYKLTERLLQGLGRGDSWRMVIDDGDVEHRYAMSVQCSATSHEASLILVDSLEEATEVESRIASWNDILGRIGAVLRERMPGDQPVKLHLAVASTTTQRTNEGCDIFALSAARKMAAEPDFARLHHAALADIRAGHTNERVVALPATALPPSFFKHSTSGNDLLDNLFHRDAVGRDAMFNPVVNGDGQTLLERWTSHMTQRWDDAASKARWYSNSYEAKRIDLIRTALSALVLDHRPATDTRSGG